MSEPADLRRLQQQLVRLASLDAERLRLLDELKSEGLLRSKGLVGEWGERIGLALLGGTLAPPSQPAYDLTDAQGRTVQVKTLRSTPGNSRTSLGVVHPGYQTLLCVRIDESFVPLAAYEIPHDLVDELYPGKRASLTRTLENHPRTRRYRTDELASALAAPRGRGG